MSANFCDFFKYFKTTFNPGSRKSEDISARYDIVPALEPEKRVPVLVPDLPTTLRDTDHNDHERYCEFRLFTLKCFESESAWDRFVSDAEASRQEVEKCDTKAPGGVFHDAYEAFIATRPYPLGSRTGRLLKQDQGGFGGGINVGNDDEEVKVKSDEVDVEDWMGSARSIIKAIDDLALESHVDQSHWDDIAVRYEHFPNLGDNWVAQMAEEGNIIVGPPEKPVNVSLLNNEQLYLLSMLKEHHSAMVSAAHSGTSPPPPLRVLVCGKGGTGKTHVLRAFREHVDREAACVRAVQAGVDVDDGGSVVRLKTSLRFPEIGDAAKSASFPDAHKNQAPLSASEVICAMAPSAQAALAVAGDTVQGACSFPRSEGTTKR